MKTQKTLAQLNLDNLLMQYPLSRSFNVEGKVIKTTPLSDFLKGVIPAEAVEAGEYRCMDDLIQASADQLMAGDVRATVDQFARNVSSWATNRKKSSFRNIPLEEAVLKLLREYIVTKRADLDKAKMTATVASGDANAAVTLKPAYKVTLEEIEAITDYTVADKLKARLASHKSKNLEPGTEEHARVTELERAALARRNSLAPMGDDEAALLAKIGKKLSKSELAALTALLKK